MFKDNKYTKCYFKIVERAKQRNLIKSKYDGNEKHHIIPKSLGGNNSKSNLVMLTAKEHFVLHLLLIKMCVLAEHKKSMLFALFNMNASNNNQARKNNSRIYQYYKKEWQELQSIRQAGIMSNPEHKKKVVKKRKETLKNNPNIMHSWKLKRTGVSKPHPIESKVRLLGDSRTEKQQQASICHSKSMKGNTNRIYTFKKVITPSGIFNSAYAAAEYFNIPYPTLAVWCAKSKNGFKYISGVI